MLPWPFTLERVLVVEDRYIYHLSSIDSRRLGHVDSFLARPTAVVACNFQSQALLSLVSEGRAFPAATTSSVCIFVRAAL